MSENEGYQLVHVQVFCGNESLPTATVKIITPDGKEIADTAIGVGPVDAICKAINRTVGISNILTTFSVRAVNEGTDAVGRVLIRIKHEGKIYTGRGESRDIIVASAEAYITALNKILTTKK